MSEFILITSIEVVGVARVREALEANEWSLDETSQLEEMGFSEDNSDNENGFSHTFATEEAEIDMELASMKTPILKEGQSSCSPTSSDVMNGQVEELGKMMGSLQAIKGKYVNSLSIGNDLTCDRERLAHA